MLNQNKLALITRMVLSSKIQGLNFGSLLSGLAKSIYFVCCSGISSPQNFVTFLGLDQDPTLSFQNGECMLWNY